MNLRLAWNLLYSPGWPPCLHLCALWTCMYAMCMQCSRKKKRSEFSWARSHRCVWAAVGFWEMNLGTVSAPNHVVLLQVIAFSLFGSTEIPGVSHYTLKQWQPVLKPNSLERKWEPEGLLCSYTTHKRSYNTFLLLLWTGTKIEIQSMRDGNGLKLLPVCGVVICCTFTCCHVTDPEWSLSGR